MNSTELKIAATILKGCIKVRQDKVAAIEHNGGIGLDELPRLNAEVDDLKLAVAYIEELVL